jgi:hypothetical protein
MDWIIQSKDGTTHHTSYDGFLMALRDLFSDPEKQFVSATLSGGTVLDEGRREGVVGWVYHRRGCYRRGSNLVTSD